MRVGTLFLAMVLVGACGENRGRPDETLCIEVGPTLVGPAGPGGAAPQCPDGITSELWPDNVATPLPVDQCAALCSPKPASVGNDAAPPASRDGGVVYKCASIRCHLPEAGAETHVYVHCTNGHEFAC